MTSLPGRFVDRVVLDSNGCWLWQGSLNKWGYGVFTVKHLNVFAHRFAYTVTRGPIPNGLEIDHLCRNRRCCNPAHLEAVTHHENQLRGKAATKTHCKHGHEFTPDNISRRPDAPYQRQCRRCRELRHAARRKAVAA